MSYSTLNWAWQVDDLKTMQKFLLVALADMADEAHSCFPGQAALARMTGSSERAVRDNLAKLEEAGYIVRVRRHRDNGSRTSDRFVLQVRRLPADSAGSDLAHLPADFVEPTGRLRPNLPAESAGVEEPPEEPPVEPPALSADEAFAAVWKLWPKKTDRKKALAKFKLATKRIPLEQLVEVATLHADAYALHRWPVEYVRGFEVWLNNDSWENPLPGPRTRGDERQAAALSLVAQYQERETHAEVGSGQAARVRIGS